MTDYRKIDALAKDAPRARRLAQFLLKLEDQQWTDWEVEFLMSMSEQKDVLTTRQGEKLVELEEAAAWFDKVPDEGFSVRLLVRHCHEARFELDDDEDILFVEDLQAKGVTKLRRRGLQRLLRCARALGIVEGYAGRSLERDISEAA